MNQEFLLGLSALLLLVIFCLVWLLVRTRINLLLIERERSTWKEQKESMALEQQRKERILQDDYDSRCLKLQQQFSEQIQGLSTLRDQQVDQINQLLKSTAKEVLDAQKEGLLSCNEQSIQELLDPFRQNLDDMKDAFEKGQQSSTRNTTLLEGALQNMLSRSDTLSEDTRRLTEALSGKGKVQGDWGEQLLSRLLDESGLMEGIHYVVQSTARNSEGQLLRPDVVVHLSQGRELIIDSKVSLTAFYNYLGAEDPDAAQKASQENLQSLKKHVKELSQKHYERLIDGSMSHVFMFVPNEASLTLAYSLEPDLAIRAMEKGVLILSPQNLLLCLHLVSQLFQAESLKLTESRILELSTEMFEKLCRFLDNFSRIGSGIQNLEKVYGDARNQLSEGKGNLLRKAEELKNLGVKSQKQLPEDLRL